MVIISINFVYVSIWAKNTILCLEKDSTATDNEQNEQGDPGIVSVEEKDDDNFEVEITKSSTQSLEEENRNLLLQLQNEMNKSSEELRQKQLLVDNLQKRLR